MGTRHLIVAGHCLAAQAGFEELEAGGNAVDAGVAAGLDVPRRARSAQSAAIRRAACRRVEPIRAAPPMPRAGDEAWESSGAGASRPEVGAVLRGAAGIDGHAETGPSGT